MTKQESFYICSENEHIYLFDLNIRSQEIETSFEEQRLLILQWRDFLHAFNNFLSKWPVERLVTSNQGVLLSRVML